MSNHAFTKAVRARMERTGQNWTTAARATREVRQKGSLRDRPGFLAPYVTSADPDVVQSVIDWHLCLDYAAIKAREYAEQMTGQGRFRYRIESGAFRVTGLSAKPQGHGRWKEDRWGGWVPWANNPALEEFEACSINAPDVLGLPAALFVYAKSGQYFTSPRPFVVGDAAWAILPEDVLPKNGTGPEFISSALWQPAKASAFHLAKERYVEANENEDKGPLSLTDEARERAEALLEQKRKADEARRVRRRKQWENKGI